MTKKTGLYIHIPFCVRKCNYCAFLSFDAETSPRKEYTDALVNEITYRGEQLGQPEIDSVYVGGGTPSVLDISQMRDIMHATHQAPLSTEFSTQEYWIRLSFSSPKDLPTRVQTHISCVSCIGRQTLYHQCSLGSP